MYCSARAEDKNLTTQSYSYSDIPIMIQNILMDNYSELFKIKHCCFNNTRTRIYAIAINTKCKRASDIPQWNNFERFVIVLRI